MTVFDAFLNQCSCHGFLVAIVPGGDRDICAIDMKMRMIYLGGSLPTDHLGVIGFHELGHALVSERSAYLMAQVFTPANADPQHVKYAYELAAWAWAEQHIPPGYEALTAEIKAWALETYQHPHAA